MIQRLWKWRLRTTGLLVAVVVTFTLVGRYAWNSWNFICPAAARRLTEFEISRQGLVAMRAWLAKRDDVPRGAIEIPTFVDGKRCCIIDEPLPPNSIAQLQYTQGTLGRLFNNYRVLYMQVKATWRDPPSFLLIETTIDRCGKPGSMREITIRAPYGWSGSPILKGLD